MFKKYIIYTKCRQSFIVKVFIIYYVMKYRKILIKYAYISQLWKYKILYFHSSENTRFDIFTGEKP